MLAQALVAEADTFVALWKDSKLPDGRDRVVRHGHRPHRAIQTGVGPVEVRRAKVRDRGEVSAEEKILFTSQRLAPISCSSGGPNQEKLGGKAMTEKTVRSHSVLRRTMLVGTAGALGGAVLRATPVRSQTSAAPAVALPGSSPPGARYGDPAWWVAPCWPLHAF
jgi:hypothetical protein